MPKACPVCHFSAWRPGLGPYGGTNWESILETGSAVHKALGRALGDVLGCLLGRRAGVSVWSLVAVVIWWCVLAMPQIASANEPETAEELTVQALSGVKLIEGDIIVSDNPFARSIAVSGQTQPWVDGIVPYSIDRTLPEHNIAAIEKAIEHWNEISGISLIAVTAIDIADGKAPDRLRFQSGSGCASWVGKRGGEQEVWVAPNCTTGSILHEIGHALGLEHEHTRPDRDNYIIIHWANIKADKTHNFDVAPTGSRLLGRYDYDSIMHYGPNNFSSDGEPTITPRFGSPDSIGQRVSPSSGDLAAIDLIYATDLSVMTRIYESDPGQDATVTISNEHAQGANGIEVSVTLEAGTLLAYQEDDWDCTMISESQLNCAIERLAAGARKELMLSLSESVDASSLHAQLSSKSPDINLQNNSNTGDFVSAESQSPIPSIGAAVGLQEDPVVVTAVGGAVSWVWSILVLLGLQRLAGHRVYRKSGSRIEGFVCIVLKR